jgi:hypothetical protein
MTTATCAISSTLPPIENITFGEAGLAYLKTNKGVRYLALDTLGTSAEWATLMRPNERLGALSSGIKEAKNWISLTDIPEQLQGAVEQVRTASEEGTLESLSQCLNKFCALFVPVADVVDALQQRISPFSGRTVQMVGTAGNGALAITSLYDFFAHFKESLTEDKIRICAGSHLCGEAQRQHQYIHSTKANQANIRALGSISDVAFGVIGLVNATTSVVVAPWIALAVYTNSLFCTLSAQFYPQIHPYSEGIRV